MPVYTVLVLWKVVKSFQITLTATMTATVTATVTVTVTLTLWKAWI